MATKRNSRFTPVFEGRTTKATVLDMKANVVVVKFARQKKTSRASAAAKQARLV